MSLIICPECGKEISDKADTCIHCGYPLKNKSIINNNEYDFNSELQLILNGEKIKAIGSIRQKTGLGLSEGKKIADYMEENKIVPTQMMLSQSYNNTPRCPRCGSTNITTGARGINFFWGPIGASKTVNRCANCGYTWKP